MEFSFFKQEIQNCILQLKENHHATKDPGYEQCQLLLRYAAEEESDVLFGLAYYSFAEHYLKQSQAENVMYCLSEGIKYYHKAEMFEYLSKDYNMMGAVAETKNKCIIALDYYYTSLQQEELYGFTYVQAMAELNIGDILLHMKKPKEALEMNNKALVHLEQSEESPFSKWNLTICYIHYGNCYLDLAEYDKAHQVYKKLQEMGEQLSCDIVPDLAIEVFGASCKLVLQDLKNAIYHIDIALEIFSKQISVIEFS